jgi:oligoendopeptidase F
MTRAIPSRSEVAHEHTWNAESIFPSDNAWEEEFQRIAESLPELQRFQGTLHHNPATLVAWLEQSQAFANRVGKLFLYASMFHSVDSAEPVAAARFGRAMALNTRVRAALAFAEPEILQIAPETLETWMEAELGLSLYRHYLDQLERRREHVRSAEIEALLGQLGEPFSAPRQAHNILTNAELLFRPAVDSSGEESEVAQGTIGALLTGPDRELRRTAWENYADAFLANKNTMANCLAGGIKQDVFFARARGYASSLEAALAPGSIPTEVFHNLIATFRKHLPVWHRYWDIRRRALGYDTLHVYDIKAPLTETTPEVPFAQAVDWICAGMQPLGVDYVETLRRGAREQRWVDIYPNKGKRMGAFSSGVQGTYPFIMMSYNDDLYGMSTLAHELGHSLHSYYTWHTQPTIYAHYSLFVAEVASNFNQAMVRAYLLETNPDPDFQIALIEEAMSNFHRYFFIMPTLARFELEIHTRVERGEALTADSLTSLMTDLFREGYGDGVEIDADRIGITWAQFPTHLYSNFYAYQYATGISGAHALARGVLSGRPEAAERYLSFLKAGSSVYPLEALQMAGVDLASPEPVEQTFAIFSDLVDRLAALLGQ